MAHDNTQAAWHINTTNCELEHVLFKSVWWFHLVAVADYHASDQWQGGPNFFNSLSPAWVWKDIRVKCSFQQKWFDRGSWLHYNEDRELAFCCMCVVACQSNLLQSAHSLEQTFISTGVLNWKDATAKFSKHEGSRCQKDSMLKTITLPTTICDVGEVLSSQLAKEWLEGCKCLLKLLSNARFLTWQGLAFCGDN